MTNRNAVLSLAGALLALSSAAKALTVDTVYRPLPHPCEDIISDCGPRPKPWNCGRIRPCEPGPFKPLSGMQGSVEAITGAVAGGDMDAASQGLGALFAGSAAGAAAAVPVGASIAPQPTPTNPNPDTELELPRHLKKAGKTTLRAIDGPVSMGQSADGVIKVNVGHDAARELVERALREAEKAAERYVNRDQTNESKEKYGGCRMKGTCSK